MKTYKYAELSDNDLLYARDQIRRRIPCECEAKHDDMDATLAELHDRAAKIDVEIDRRINISEPRRDWYCGPIHLVHGMGRSFRSYVDLTKINVSLEQLDSDTLRKLLQLPHSAVEYYSGDDCKFIPCTATGRFGSRGCDDGLELSAIYRQRA